MHKIFSIIVKKHPLAFQSHLELSNQINTLNHNESNKAKHQVVVKCKISYNHQRDCGRIAPDVDKIINSCGCEGLFTYHEVIGL